MFVVCGGKINKKEYKLANYPSEGPTLLTGEIWENTVVKSLREFFLTKILKVVVRYVSYKCYKNCSTNYFLYEL